MKQIILDIMEEHGIDANHVDFLEAVIDLLGTYADEIKDKEPYATLTIKHLLEARKSLIGLSMSEEVE
jgi:hypothetical protein